jgi:hypothetical protein
MKYVLIAKMYSQNDDLEVSIYSYQTLAEEAAIKRLLAHIKEGEDDGVKMNNPFTRDPLESRPSSPEREQALLEMNGAYPGMFKIFRVPESGSVGEQLTSKAWAPDLYGGKRDDQ